MSPDGTTHGGGKLRLIAKEKGVDGTDARKGIAMEGRGGRVKDVVLPPEEVPQEIAPVLMIKLVGNCIAKIVG